MCTESMHVHVCTVYPRSLSHCMALATIAPRCYRSRYTVHVGQAVVSLHSTDRRKLVTIFIIQLYRQKCCTPFEEGQSEHMFRVLDECTEGIVLQQSNLVDSTVTLHLHLVVRNKRWNSLQVEQEAERMKR